MIFQPIFAVLIFLLTLISVSFFMYVAGAARYAKAFFIALPAAVGLGGVVTLGLGFLIWLLGSVGGWEAVQFYTAGILIGLCVTVVAFGIVFPVALKRLKSSRPRMVSRIVFFIAGVLSLLAAGAIYYEITPRLYPTSRLIREMEGTRYKAARRELVRRGGKAIPQLLEAITAAPKSRNASTYRSILAEIPGAETTDALFTLLENPDPEIRLWAATQLASRKEKRALDVLLEQLKRPPFDASRKTVLIAAIAQLGEPSAVPAMLSVVEPPSPKDYNTPYQILYDAAVIQAMGTLKHPQAYEFLLNLHTHPRPRVRLEVAKQLSHYPCRRTARALIGLLDDPEALIRREADRTLFRIAAVCLNSEGRGQAPDDSGIIRSRWLKWMEENGEKLPQEPSFAE